MSESKKKREWESKKKGVKKRKRSEKSQTKSKKKEPVFDFLKVHDHANAMTLVFERDKDNTIRPKMDVD